MFFLKNGTKDWGAQLIHVKVDNSVWCTCGDVNSPWFVCDTVGTGAQLICYEVGSITFSKLRHNFHNFL
jgi:hypothetical protein